MTDKLKSSDSAALPSPQKCSGCGVNFAEFPELKHARVNCPGPECTCYEFIGGHQMGCPLYGRKAKAEIPTEKCPVEALHLPALAEHLVDDLLDTPNERARLGLIDMVKQSLEKACTHDRMCRVCCRPCVVDAEIQRSAKGETL